MPDDEFAQLKTLLLGPEQAQLEKHEVRLERGPTPQMMARALPDAIMISAGKGTAFREAIAPTVAEALKITVRRDPQPLVDIIFPLLGPLIRRSVQASLASMIQSLNQATQYGLNFRMRFAAWRARVPFGEYVLLHTLVYRVEQVYLIHNLTGVLLLSVEDPSATSADPDMVASMMSAITDFVRDSFQAAEGDALEQLKMGDRQLLMARGTTVSLAVVVRGTPPSSLQQDIAESLEAIHFRHAEDFDTYKGDTAPFERSRGDLERLLHSERVAPAAAPSTGLRLLALLLLLGVGLLAGYWLLSDMRWRGYLRELDNTPGIVVARASSDWLGWGQREVSGLRDPLSRDPAELLPQFGLAGQVQTRWQPFESLAPALVFRRVYQAMNPPASVKLVFADGILRASGRASADWIQRARVLGTALPGVERYVDTGLQDIEPIGRLRQLLGPPEMVKLALLGRTLVASGSAPDAWIQGARKLAASSADVDTYDDRGVENLDVLTLTRLTNALGQISIYFEEGTDHMRGAAASQLDLVAKDWAALRTQSATIGRRYLLQVTGQSDATGVPQQNQILATRRATTVRADLLRRGLATDEMSIEAVRSKHEDPRLRRVIFLVVPR